MKQAKVMSDYSDSILTVTQSDDGDCSLNIFGEGEFRIALDGSRLIGDKLANVINDLSKLIDDLNS